MDTYVVYGVFLGANFLAAMSGGLFQPGDWYESLKKPSWNPPNWLFPVVWAVLYIMIAVAGARVWQAAGTEASFALAVYGVQLALNFAWSALFFGLRRMDFAFYEVLALWASIAWLIALFLPIDPIAGYLLMPYLVWVTIAAVLNWTVWRLNSGVVEKAA